MERLHLYIVLIFLFQGRDKPKHSSTLFTQLIRSGCPVEQQSGSFDQFITVQTVQLCIYIYILLYVYTVQFISVFRCHLSRFCESVFVGFSISYYIYLQIFLVLPYPVFLPIYYMDSTLYCFKCAIKINLTLTSVFQHLASGTVYDLFKCQI